MYRQSPSWLGHCTLLLLLLLILTLTLSRPLSYNLFDVIFDVFCFVNHDNFPKPKPKPKPKPDPKPSPKGLGGIWI